MTKTTTPRAHAPEPAPEPNLWERLECRGHMPAVQRLAKRFPKRLTAAQRDLLARTLRQYGRAK